MIVTDNHASDVDGMSEYHWDVAAQRWEHACCDKASRFESIRIQYRLPDKADGIVVVGSIYCPAFHMFSYV